MHACMHSWKDGRMDGRMDVCMVSGPGPPSPPHGIPPPPPPAPGSRAPAPSGPAQPERTHANQREGGRWRMIPARCFFTGAENRIRAGTGAPFARRKEQHHILYGNEHVTMTLLLTSGSNHTISVEHTQTGRGQPKRPQAPPHRGGRGQGM